MAASDSAHISLASAGGGVFPMWPDSVTRVESMSASQLTQIHSPVATTATNASQHYILGGRWSLRGLGGLESARASRPRPHRSEPVEVEVYIRLFVFVPVEHHYSTFSSRLHQFM